MVENTSKSVIKLNVHLANVVNREAVFIQYLMADKIAMELGRRSIVKRVLQE